MSISLSHLQRVWVKSWETWASLSLTVKAVFACGRLVMNCRSFSPPLSPSDGDWWWWWLEDDDDANQLQHWSPKCITVLCKEIRVFGVQVCISVSFYDQRNASWGRRNFSDVRFCWGQLKLWQDLSILTAAQFKMRPNWALHIKCNTVTAHSQCAEKHFRSVRIAFAVSQILFNA
jgi:hypothetical protein